MVVPLKVSLCRFDEFVHEPGCEGVFDTEALLSGCGSQPDEEVGFAGSGITDQA